MNHNLIVLNQNDLNKGEQYIIDLLLSNKIEKLPIVDDNMILKGLITLRDILYRTKNKHIALLDSNHQLIVP
jgi:signal-transduction protein with cAMP-binding, CBS, and nucleotidyltransferase domain